MGDQSIPGQDEDIFLGTNQINVFLCPFCSITGTNIILVRYFFVSSWVRSCGNSFCHLDAELSMVLFDS
jgi:hypothetical protein